MCVKLVNWKFVRLTPQFDPIQFNSIILICVCESKRATKVVAATGMIIMSLRKNSLYSKFQISGIIILNLLYSNNNNNQHAFYCSPTRYYTLNLPTNTISHSTISTTRVDLSLHFGLPLIIVGASYNQHQLNLTRPPSHPFMYHSWPSMFVLAGNR